MSLYAFVAISPFREAGVDNDAQIWLAVWMLVMIVEEGKQMLRLTFRTWIKNPWNRFVVVSVFLGPCSPH